MKKSQAFENLMQFPLVHALIAIKLVIQEPVAKNLYHQAPVRHPDNR
jgi:hypothetical protein